MQIRWQHILFTALVVSLVSLAYGINYQYISDCELTVFGDRIKFFHGDTLQWRVHSNGQIAIMDDPQFFEQVSSAACDFWRGPNFNPNFHGFTPRLCSDTVIIPRTAEDLRTCAATQGTFYSDPRMKYRVHLRGNEAYILRTWRGVPFDSSDSWTIELNRRRCIFFDGPLEIEGRMTGEASIGCSGNMLLLDNVAYEDADLSRTGCGRVPPRSGNYLMLCSEADIKIANTPANGRENSAGGGLSQPNLDSTSIFITAALYALGESFTFEQQNDADSGYVYQNPPGTPARDDRGTVYLYGSLAQHRRGYVHRGTNGSSGYIKQYLWDPRFGGWDPPGGFEFDRSLPLAPDTLDFGGVPVSHTVWDTAHVSAGGLCNLGSVIATSPFYATRVPPYYAARFSIPVSFTPIRTGTFSGMLYISTPYRYFQIVLRGRGLPGGAPPLVFDISPNPFNLTTTLRYTLEQTGTVKITLHDILGRTAKEMDLGSVESGEHTVQLNATGLASGVYFVRLQSGEQIATKKVLLLK